LSRFCLDTSAYSHFMRGTPEVVALIDGASSICVPSVVVGELRVGFALGSRQDENERLLAAFLRQPVVELLAVDEEAARIYAEIVVGLRAAGTPVPTNDVWIAATAAAAGAVVLTYDAHFRHIHRVSCRVLA
jgi:tRNA(fMet)-specific endonuclease VapC